MKRPYLCCLTLGLCLGSCDLPVADCGARPQWCQPLMLQALGTIGRASARPSLQVQLASPELTPPYETHFRVSIEQSADGAGSAAIGGGQDLLGPEPAGGWSVDLASPLPEATSLRCGAANLYLHSRLLAGPIHTDLTPATDQASEKYLQHGMASFSIIDGLPMTFQGSGKLPGGTAISKLGLSKTMPPTIFATLAGGQTQLAVGTLTLKMMSAIAAPSTSRALQYVGEAGQLHLVAKPMSGNRCGFRLAACAELSSASDAGDPQKCISGADTTGSWCFPAKSLATDDMGSYLASVGPAGYLSLHNLTIDKDRGPTAQQLSKQGPYPNYRYVAVGNLDGDQVMDVLALGQPMTPLVLLREGTDFNNTPAKQASAARIAAELAKASTELQASDAVVALGHFATSSMRPGVMVASAGAVQVLQPLADSLYTKCSVSLEKLPPKSDITALHLADTNGDGKPDLLLVAVRPDTVYIYELQLA